MFTKKEAPGADGFWLGLVILAVGIAIGWLARPERWFDRGGDAFEAGEIPPAELHPYLVPVADPEAVPDNGLATLGVHLPPASAAVLQEVRDRAMERGLIVQEEGDTVPAEIELGDQRLAAEVRIKGDWTDHVKTDKWSLRIGLEDGKLLGMRTFSIQAPETRGKLWEWFVLAAARREGVLAPRATFVNVTVNGNPAGVYYLEEHFSKEMLEAQGRREGPIVLWDESTHWSTRLQSHMVGDAAGRMRPPQPLHGMDAANAESRAFGEKRLGEIESLSRTLYASLEKMRDLRALLTKKEDLQDRAWLLQELVDLQSDSVEEIVNVEMLSRAHALLSLFQIRHALSWHNMRFYHDPVLDRLEPVMFDNMAHNPSARLPVMFRSSGLAREFSRCRPYYDGVFAELGRLCHPEWLDELFDALEPDLARFEAALAAEETLKPDETVAGMKQRLRAQQGFLRRILYPSDPINVEAFYEVDDSSDALVSGVLEVLVWATSQSPTAVEGFRFSDGGFVPAAPHALEGMNVFTRNADGSVVLPYDGSTVTFRFPLDERLANLASARELKQAVRERATPPASLDLDVAIVFRSVAATETTDELLRFRAFERRWLEEGGRPEPPSLTEALERHPFLRPASETGALVVRPGTWDVDGDLVLPTGTALVASAGTTLRFGEDAVLLTDAPLRLRGTAEAPVVLEPVAGAYRWRGIAVLGAPARSTWEHVVVRNTDAVARKGWVVTGGITFYHSPVTMLDCRIEGTLAEDGLNVFGCDFRMERVTFSGCASDSLDGDFVTGSVRACEFLDGAADGVDFSGSDVHVVECLFRDLGDKAISLGEDTTARIVGGLAERVSIGVAAKDRSDVTVQGLTVRDARNYALTAFVKKPEFGPSRLVAERVTITGSGLGDVLAQTGCTLTIEGEAVATQELDVAELYRQGILGR
jgi:hypothetical protein